MSNSYATLVSLTSRVFHQKFEKKLAAISVSLRDRMRFYKLRVTPNAATIASQFNEQFKPEVIADHNDLLQVEWLDKAKQEDVITGEKVIKCTIRCADACLTGRDKDISPPGSLFLRLHYKVSHSRHRFQHKRLQLHSTDPKRPRSHHPKDSERLLQN